MPTDTCTLQVPTAAHIRSLPLPLSLMAASSCLALHSPPKWIGSRLAALTRLASRLIQLHTLVTFHLRRDISPSACSGDCDEKAAEDFLFFEVEQTFFKVCTSAHAAHSRRQTNHRCRQVHMSLFHFGVWPLPHPVAKPLSEYIPADIIVLSDTADNFRYFLWDLQALSVYFFICHSNHFRPPT
jgi:hypothetical protein